MEYEYDYDPVENEELVPSVEPDPYIEELESVEPDTYVTPAVNAELNSYIELPNMGGYDAYEAPTAEERPSYYYERSSEPLAYTPVIAEQKDEAVANKKANRLCLLSLACVVLPTLLIVLLSLLIEIGVDVSLGISAINVVSSYLYGPACITSLFLMIYVRVKYPNNVFGKVLMWTYIVVIIINVLCAILIMAFLVWLCHDCSSGMLYVLPALLGGM